MKSTKSIYYVGVVIVVVVGLFLWFNNANKKPPTKSVGGFIQPLTFKVGVSEFTSTERREIAKYKKWILDRVKSKTPLTEEEKGVIRVSLLTNQKSSPLGIVVIDQSIYQFTADELRAISEALKR